MRTENFRKNHNDLKMDGKNSQKNRKGFTLVELILVIFVIGLLGTASVGAYINSAETFTYLDKYKSFVSSIRAARSYALTNRDNGGELPPRYGISVEQDSIVLFADLGSTEGIQNEFKFVSTGDDPDKIIPGKSNKDGVNGAGKSFQDIMIKAYGSDKRPLTLPAKIYYETVTGGVVFYNHNDEKLEDGYIAFEFADTKSDQKKYLVVFEVSGLAEEYAVLP